MINLRSIKQTNFLLIELSCLSYNCSNIDKMNSIIRKAHTIDDVESVSDIYDLIHTQEEEGAVSKGWKRGIYPIFQTALQAFDNDTLFVKCINDRVVASAIINQYQPEGYTTADWQYAADENKVGVLHTLVVHPDFSRQGLGKEFVAFFEFHCRSLGYDVVRLDTQVKNKRPFNLYPKLGYRLATIKEVPFQGLSEMVELAMFEKRL